MMILREVEQEKAESVKEKIKKVESQIIKV